MKAHMVPTDQFYRDVVNAPDAATRQARYLSQFMEPWQQMMGMMAGVIPGAEDQNDSLAGARAWNWLLPDDLSTLPAALVALEAANAWEIANAALAKASASFAPYADRIPFDTVEGWLVLGDPQKCDPVMRGYTGATDWFQPRFVAQYHIPDSYNLPRLPGLVAHEMHHLIRLRLFPWHMGTTVADYIVLEGLAESFAAALFGEDILGYYVTDFDETQLDTAKSIMKAGLGASGFDVIRGYIFGDYWADQYGMKKVGMPAYGGYAIGYRVVQAYLQRTGQTVQEATFVPTSDIIGESGYFD